MSDSLVVRLKNESDLSDAGLRTLLQTDEFDNVLFAAAEAVRKDIYGNDVYIRGLIEFTNYCKNNCYYCVIRSTNSNAVRYRLSKDDILSCCKEGYALGYRTFVLQGGEDPFFSDNLICEIITSIRKKYPDCAITLSLGENQKQAIRHTSTQELIVTSFGTKQQTKTTIGYCTLIQ